MMVRQTDTPALMGPASPRNRPAMVARRPSAVGVSDHRPPSRQSSASFEAMSAPSLCLASASATLFRRDLREPVGTPNVGMTMCPIWAGTSILERHVERTGMTGDGAPRRTATMSPLANCVRMPTSPAYAGCHTSSDTMRNAGAAARSTGSQDGQRFSVAHTDRASGSRCRPASPQYVGLSRIATAHAWGVHKNGRQPADRSDHFARRPRFRRTAHPNNSLTISPRLPPILTDHHPTRRSRNANVFGKSWSGREDLNLRPLGPEPSRLLLNYARNTAVSHSA
jgi:hypothetical protein